MKKLIRNALCLLIISVSLYAQSFEGIKNINGADIFCRTAGNGTPIVLVHGGPGLAHNYLYEHFSPLEKKFQLIYYDQRGCGLSQLFKENENISVDLMVEDLEGIRKEFGLEKMNLAGQSWGAVIALNYLFKYPEKVNTLVLLEPAPGSSEFLPIFQKNLQSRLSKQALARMTELGAKPLLRSDPVLFREFMGLRMKKYYFDTTKFSGRQFAYFDSNKVKMFFASSAKFSPYLANYNLFERMKEIKLPVLIIAGDYDPIPNESVYRMKELIPGCELHIIKDCGHFVHIEKPDEYFGLIENFLNNHK